MRKQIFNYFQFVEAGLILVIAIGLSSLNFVHGGEMRVPMLIFAITVGAVVAFSIGLLPVPMFVSDLRRLCLRRGDLATFLCSKEDSGDLIELKGSVLEMTFGRPKPVSPQMELFFLMEYPNGAWYSKIASGAEVHDVPFTWISRVD